MHDLFLPLARPVSYWLNYLDLLKNDTYSIQIDDFLAAEGQAALREEIAAGNLEPIQHTMRGF